MKKTAQPLRLCDFVEELSSETKVFLYMENVKQGSRKKLLDSEASDAQKRNIFAQFANAVIGSVVKAGEALRIIYLDENRTEAMNARLAALDSGEQLQL